MKKILLVTCLIFFIFSCGPDCPPCPDSSGNLNIPAEHCEILECAGFDDYVKKHIRCTFFIDDLRDEEGKSVYGLADCNCDDIYVNLGHTIYHIIGECQTIIHETAHLERICENDEDYSLHKAWEFDNNLAVNNCYLASSL